MVLIKAKKICFLVLLIFLIGFFLRFFRIQENLLFNPEHGRDFLAIKEAIFSRQLPLLGPPGSHEFYQGPLYYWLMMPLMLVFGFQPLIGAWVGIMAGSLIILLNYWVIEKVFNQKVALFSSLIIAISPIWIYFSREGRYYFLTVITFYLLFWFLYELWQGKGKFLFWAGLAYGAMLSFHLGSIALAPVIALILWVKRKKLDRKDIGRGLIGFLIPNLPLLVYDLTHGLTMSSKLLVWIPYRIIGFFGFYPKNNLTPEVLRENVQAFLKFFGENFTMHEVRLDLLLIGVIVGFLIFNYKKAFTFKGRKDFGWFFLFWTLLLFSLALFVHGSPPRHYFISILPLPIIISSLFLEKLWRSYLGKALFIFFLLLMTFFNHRFFFDSPAFYAAAGDSLLFFKSQEKIVRTIIIDAQNRPFNLKRVGEFDYYPGEHAQNYRYLAWWMGNEPSEEQQKLSYTIYEDLNRLPADEEGKVKIFEVGRVVILKEEK